VTSGQSVFFTYNHTTVTQVTAAAILNPSSRNTPSAMIFPVRQRLHIEEKTMIVGGLSSVLASGL
jgi:hypothetical protein